MPRNGSAEGKDWWGSRNILRRSKSQWMGGGFWGEEEEILNVSFLLSSISILNMSMIHSLGCYQMKKKINSEQ